MTMRKLKKYVPTKFKSKKSVYDRDAADYAVNFIQALYHTKGTWAGKPFELIDWQEQIIRDLFGTLKPNGYERLPAVQYGIHRDSQETRQTACFGYTEPNSRWLHHYGRNPDW